MLNMLIVEEDVPKILCRNKLMYVTKDQLAFINIVFWDVKNRDYNLCFHKQMCALIAAYVCVMALKLLHLIISIIMEIHLHKHSELLHEWQFICLSN